MLFESITYHGELPFSLSFLNVGEENKHCHKEIEILMVLRGVTNYQIYHTDYELSPGDLIIADVEDLHQIHDSSEDILILSIHVDTDRFAHLYSNIRYMFFVCEECMDSPSVDDQLFQSKLSLLKRCIAKLALDYSMTEKNLSLLMDEVNDLVSILVDHFQGFYVEDYQYKTSRENIGKEDLRRLSRITRYILTHYDQKITLDDVSRMEHLSTYYVSHLIKKTLGFNFQNFVNGIRLEFGEKMLVFTNLSLMQISQNCGFSSPNYFNKCFSAWHGKTPAEYRKDYHPGQRTFKRAFTTEEALKLLRPYLNTSRNKGDDAPLSIKIKPDFKTSNFIDFWKTYSPSIIITSMEDMVRLGYLESEIKNIRPSSFIVNKTLKKNHKELEQTVEIVMSNFEINKVSISDSFEAESSIQIPTLCDAFDLILSGNSPTKVKLFGNEGALFTEFGLITPIYQFYYLFTKMINPQICLYDNYFLVRGDASSFVVLYNNNAYSVLNVHIDLDFLPENFFLLKTEVTQNENCYAIMESLNNPEGLPSILKDQINNCNHGNTDYSLVEKEKDSSLGLMLYPRSAILLEIII
ncbi:MAG: AraC family transcriptional regulator [Anaerovoracaceae bacterium]